MSYCYDNVKIETPWHNMYNDLCRLGKEGDSLCHIVTCQGGGVTSSRSPPKGTNMS